MDVDPGSAHIPHTNTNRATIDGPRFHDVQSWDGFLRIKDPERRSYTPTHHPMGGPGRSNFSSSIFSCGTWRYVREKCSDVSTEVSSSLASVAKVFPDDRLARPRRLNFHRELPCVGALGLTASNITVRHVSAGKRLQLLVAVPLRSRAHVQ